MAIKKTTGAPNSPEKTNIRRQKLGAILSSNPSTQDITQHNNFSNFHHRNSTDTSPMSSINYSNPSSAPSSPYNLMASPWTQPSPYINSPWIHPQPNYEIVDEYIKDMKTLPKHGLIGSFLREEGHIYSLAASGDLLYTGSESKNIRVWKDLENYSEFKSSSGLVKAIVVFKDRIFTGHQDGKIRVWRNKGKSYSRVGNFPTTRDLLLKSVNPRNYVQVRRNTNIPWIKHYDAVSCMSVDTDQGLLYSGSWDRTLKVWRISDSKCLESINAHDDAVNSVVVGFDGLVFTGSADGSVKAWRLEAVGKHTEHVLVDTLMEQDHALTSLAVCHAAGAVYAGSSDGLVSYWERERHFMTYGGVLRGHKLAVLCLAAARNLVISGSADKSICVWRRVGGRAHECVSVLKGHYGPVKCLAVEKDKSIAAEEEESGGDTRWIVYSGSLDKSIKVWRVSEEVSRLSEVEEE